MRKEIANHGNTYYPGVNNAGFRGELETLPAKFLIQSLANPFLEERGAWKA